MLPRPLSLIDQEQLVLGEHVLRMLPVEGGSLRHHDVTFLALEQLLKQSVVRKVHILTQRNGLLLLVAPGGYVRAP